MACDSYNFWKRVVQQVPLSSYGRKMVLDKYTKDVMYFLCFSGKEKEVQLILEAYIKWRALKLCTD